MARGSATRAARTAPHGEDAPDSREGQHERRRDLLIAAAAAEIADKGFDGVRLRDVARRCDVTTGMVQHYFETRDDLLTAALEYSATRHVRQWQEVLRLSEEPLRGIRTLLTEMADEFSHSEDNAVWIELCALASRDERFRPLVARVFDEWQSTIERAVSAAEEAGTIRLAVPAEDATRILLAAIDGFEMRLAATGSTSSAARDQRRVGQLADLLLIEA